MKKTITLLLVLLLLTGCGTKFGTDYSDRDANAQYCADLLTKIDALIRDECFTKTEETQQLMEQTKKEIEPAKEPPLVDDIIGDI